MVYIHVRHQIENYALWREGFDNHAPAREAGGATDEVLVLRNVEDPNDITVILGWSDLDKARTFIHSVSLRGAMQNAGVTNDPEVRILETTG
jgi:hypothetical protein